VESRHVIETDLAVKRSTNVTTALLLSAGLPRERSAAAPRRAGLAQSRPERVADRRGAPCVRPALAASSRSLSRTSSCVDKALSFNPAITTAHGSARRGRASASPALEKARSTTLLRCAASAFRCRLRPEGAFIVAARSGSGPVTFTSNPLSDSAPRDRR
jgi:hypothetical protein